jgi:hypothetical protein
MKGTFSVETAADLRSIHDSSNYPLLADAMSREIDEEILAEIYKSVYAGFSKPEVVKIIQGYFPEYITKGIFESIPYDEVMRIVKEEYPEKFI